MAKKILVVDDEMGMQAALKEVLSRMSFDVQTVSSAEEAIDLIQKENFSALISDVRMPDMSGIELLDWIKAKNPRLPVIIMTAYGTIDDAVEAMRKGAGDYILKPFSPKTVQDAVNRVLNAPQIDQPIMAKKDNTISFGKKEFISVSASMDKIKKLAQEIADSRATLLIQGESGTGKEVLAKYIHEISGRKDGPFIAINCAALPAGLLESELFGYEKGSFTGADITRKGKFELANGGTILLDEVSEMELSLQAKLLRVLQEHEIFSLGSSKPIKLDIRVIATTNRELKKEVDEKRFREDLYYRLNVIPFVLPPLRERMDDIAVLCEFFIKKHCKLNNRETKKLSSEVIGKIMSMEWKGNVRELENFIERAILLTKGEEIKLADLFLDQNIDDVKNDFIPFTGMSLEDMEKKLIMNTLKMANNNKTKAADMLGVSVRTIRNKINQYSLPVA